MKKQSGFTLIELMVVMAIIAILATAGLTAYNGYIKKARDSTRIADLKTIHRILQDNMASGLGIPQNVEDLALLIETENNGNMIYDPLLQYENGNPNSWDYPSDGSGPRCWKDSSGTVKGLCAYTYRLCDNGIGYKIGTRFESSDNLSLYIAENWRIPMYEIGDCQVSCETSCPSIDPNYNQQCILQHGSIYTCSWLSNTGD